MFHRALCTVPRALTVEQGIGTIIITVRSVGFWVFSSDPDAIMKSSSSLWALERPETLKPLRLAPSNLKPRPSLGFRV